MSVRSSADPRTGMERRAAMTLAKRLTQVFNIDVETCRACGSAVKVIACISNGTAAQYPWILGKGVFTLPVSFQIPECFQNTFSWNTLWQAVPLRVNVGNHENQKLWNSF